MLFTGFLSLILYIVAVFIDFIPQPELNIGIINAFVSFTNFLGKGLYFIHKDVFFVIVGLWFTFTTVRFTLAIFMFIMGKIPLLDIH